MKNKILSSSLIFLFILIFVVFYKSLNNSNIYVPEDDIKVEIPLVDFEIFGSSRIINSGVIFKDDKYYLMNIWASWCVPCKEEHKYLVYLSKNKNLELIGLNYKDNIINAKKFLNELSNPYSNIFSDKDGTIAIEWGAYGVPETFLIYKKNIIKKFIGPLDEVSTLKIEELVK